MLIVVIFRSQRVRNIICMVYAGVAELADALDLGSSGRPCRFKSCCPYFESADHPALFFCVNRSVLSVLFCMEDGIIITNAFFT